MIAIRKGEPPPDLVRAGEEHARELCNAYDADPDAYLSGTKEMPIRELIYKAEAVKTELGRCHHGKCCYCETPISNPAFPHVEHWRPQRSSRQDRGQARIRPGYYWLAYSWDNLFWSCAFCNSYKNDLFPLEDPVNRARHHGMSIDEEVPAILKPDGDQDPRNHITFQMEVPVGVTPIGRTTIDVLRLRWADELRRRCLDEIRKAQQLFLDLRDSVDPKLQQHAESFRKFVEDAVRPEKPYSAMVADYLDANPFPNAAV